MRDLRVVEQSGEGEVAAVAGVAYADTLAAIDPALGDVVFSDAEDTYGVSPKARLV